MTASSQIFSACLCGQIKHFEIKSEDLSSLDVLGEKDAFAGASLKGRPEDDDK